MDWIIDHKEDVIAALGALYAFASIVVALTPTPKDDEWLRRLLDWISILKPNDAPGTLKAPLLQATPPKLRPRP